VDLFNVGYSLDRWIGSVRDTWVGIVNHEDCHFKAQR
jgi:hypothetical protein